MKKKEVKDKLKIVVVSSLAENTGCALRAKYIARSLKSEYTEVRYVSGINTKPLMLDFIITLVLNIRLLFIPSDIIIGCKPYPNIAFWMYLAKVVQKKYIVFDIDDADTFRKGIVGRIGSMVQKPYPKKANLVTYHNRNLLNYIAENFDVQYENIHQLVQGVDMKFFHPLKAQEDKLFGIWREHYLKQNNLLDKRLLLYIGHLNIASDLDSIFKILEAIVVDPEYNDTRLVVIGGGNMLNHFRMLASKMHLDEYCVFTGYVDYRDVIRYASLSSQAIVYYSDSEENYMRQSMKMRELLAMGHTVICNDVGELKEFADYTYQVSGFSIEKMAAMVKKVMPKKNPSFEDSMQEQESNTKRENAYAYIKEHYNWDTIGAMFLERLQEDIKEINENIEKNIEAEQKTEAEKDIEK